MEYSNPVDANAREDWPPGHDIGVFMSVGDAVVLVGTARGQGDVATLFRSLAYEWTRIAAAGRPSHWFFAGDVS